MKPQDFRELEKSYFAGDMTLDDVSRRVAMEIGDVSVGVEHRDDGEEGLMIVGLNPSYDFTFFLPNGYLVVVEKSDNNYSAYVPDLPGCISVGDTEDEIKSMIAEAVDFHIDGIQKSGQPVPPPSFPMP